MTIAFSIGDKDFPMYAPTDDPEFGLVPALRKIGEEIADLKERLIDLAGQIDSLNRELGDVSARVDYLEP